MPKPPVVSFFSSETSAMNSGLLACTESDDGTVEGVTDRVGLSVFQSNGRNEQIKRSLGSKLRKDDEDIRLDDLRRMTRRSKGRTSLLAVTMFLKRDSSMTTSFRRC